MSCESNAHTAPCSLMSADDGSPLGSHNLVQHVQMTKDRAVTAPVLRGRPQRGCWAAFGLCSVGSILLTAVSVRFVLQKFDTAAHQRVKPDRRQDIAHIDQIGLGADLTV